MIPLTKPGCNGGGFDKYLDPRLAPRIPITSPSRATLSPIHRSSANKMHLSLILPVLAGLASAVTTTPPHRRHDPFPGPREVQLVQLAFAGSGCPVGFLPAQNQTGPTTLTLPKTNVTAESGRNISIASSRSNCQMLAKLKYSPGWQFSVSQADYTGYVDLPAGVTGTSKTIYYFSGGSDQV